MQYTLLKLIVKKYTLNTLYLYPILYIPITYGYIILMHFVESVRYINLSVENKKT